MSGLLGTEDIWFNELNCIECKVTTRVKEKMYDASCLVVKLPA